LSIAGEATRTGIMSRQLKLSALASIAATALFALSTGPSQDRPMSPASGPAMFSVEMEPRLPFLPLF
jgi:hypothetical protein